jgi:hypothetical protein
MNNKIKQPDNTKLNKPSSQIQNKKRNWSNRTHMLQKANLIKKGSQNSLLIKILLYSETLLIKK